MSCGSPDTHFENKVVKCRWYFWSVPFPFQFLITMSAVVVFSSSFAR